MKSLIKISLIIFVIVLSSCTTTVRYSSEREKKKNHKPQIVTKSKLKTKSKNTHKTDIPLIDFDKLNFASSEVEENPSEDQADDLIIKYSYEWLGTPYRWGGNTKSGVDCSGFTKNVFDKLGYRLPRTAAMQYDFTKKIKKSIARTGDLVFFKDKGKISHVGIYVDGGRVIHASRSRGVIEQDLNSPWLKEHFHSIGRIYL